MPRTGDYSLKAYVDMFRSQGFELCDDRGIETGYEKIALYANRSGEFSHVAILIPSGRWASKMGDWEDIEHETPDDLNGDLYRAPRAFMRRHAKDSGLFM